MGKSQAAGSQRTLLAVTALVGSLVAALLPGSSRASVVRTAPAGESITVDGRSPGREFDGIGALSAGASTRLLVDYPQPQRGQILDYLFEPAYGASLDILKVEIGGDMDSTAGAERSHMRTPSEVNCSRGYEWWLMREAKQRHPGIEFHGLMWGAPGWFDGGMWSADHVRYIVEWLDCAEKNGFQVDYIGGANEWFHPSPEASFFVKLDEALAESHPDVKIVATDEHTPPDYWAVATEMEGKPAFRRAVDILGEHQLCGRRTFYRQCAVSKDALSLGKPLWNSEQSTEDYAAWGGALARALNRNYIDARLTANINWSAVSAFYASFLGAGTGLILADRPWSGYYDLGEGVWVDAHTTQFTEPGWRYLNSASGYTSGGASYVALRSPDSDEYSIVIETMDSSAAETMSFHVTGGLPAGPVYLWASDLGPARVSNTSDDFRKVRTIMPEDRSFTITVRPDHVYTLSTTSEQHKGPRNTTGTARAAADPGARMPLPYRENFEHTGDDNLAAYISDAHGAFQPVPCQGREGTCYQQMITRKPIAWHDRVQPPTTVVGDPRWWGDYEVRVRARLDKRSYVELLGRVESQQKSHVAGYHLRLTRSGRWRLYTEDITGKRTTLASGPAPTGKGAWHDLALRFQGRTILAFVDKQRVARLSDAHHTSGQVGLRVSPWETNQFDNMRVEPIGRPPRFVAQGATNATATSTHGPAIGLTYEAAKVVDDRPETFWHSAPGAGLPESITIDLGHVRRVFGLAYKPRLDTPTGGTVTRYHVAVSTDGESFDRVAAGRWAETVATKTASWRRPQRARYVRLEAVQTAGGAEVASAAAVTVATTPIRSRP